ncbi:MAG: aminotransferase class V-fold PLP-dependent enzyme [Clostridiales bacterium]|nr:aminotransferase class V-fold PLP-dependent enzyme [Clostridiales bacterium]
MRDRIYLDYAATTPLGNAARTAMLPWLGDLFGNASSVHGNGREARKACEKARKQIAEAIGAEPNEIYFTSGGSESDNWAVKGTAFAHQKAGNHIITTAIEHHAILNTCKWLEKQGFSITYLPVDEEGWISPEQVEKAITNRTILISVMTANNEIGTIEPVDEIGKIARHYRIPFHTDAVQAIGSVPISCQNTGADLISLSAHKFYGPQGVGALYIRSGLKIEPLIHGGNQERGLRAGTNNVAGIAGMGAAISECMEAAPNVNRSVREYRDRLIRGIIERVPDCRLNGPEGDRRLPGNCHFSFDGIEGEALLLRLDLAGIACSGGSACTSGSPSPSHVLDAIGLNPSMMNGSLRITLGRHTTRDEIDEVLNVLPEIVQQLRCMRGS